MKLHLDLPAFETLLLGESESSGIRAGVLEKDYYVTLILNELANKKDQAFAYFKGGTALYKAIGNIRRFSEDIDLTVSIEDCTNSQAKKRVERATLEYSCLPRNKEDEENINSKGSITSIYRYTSVVSVDHEDELQRFERVKIETTSFTVSEPHEPMSITPIILDIATPEQKEILKNQYDICAFKIETIKLERIFIDKVFAAEFYFLRKMYFDMAKHLYDIVVLLKNERIQKALHDKELLGYLIDLKRKEESQRIGSDLDQKEIGQFSYFHVGMEDEELIKQFTRMQRIYDFNDEYLIPVEEFQNGIGELGKYFSKNDKNALLILRKGLNKISDV
jgi:predicted nucleotidyltransferase component of viral defense system